MKASFHVDLPQDEQKHYDLVNCTKFRKALQEIDSFLEDLKHHEISADDTRNHLKGILNHHGIVISDK